MIREMIFGTAGGLGLFLFGMGLMSDGLKKVAGQKLKTILESLTKNRVIAAVVGTCVTCLIQSSSATTVMTVGIVNAGLLTLRQALCVVLGANVGTTFTAFLISAFAVFKITSYALPMAGVGFLLTIIGRTQKAKGIGQTILGFGLLFLGIHFMKEAFAPLQGHQQVHDVLIWVGRYPLLAVLAGTAITMLLQSSSASVAMIQLLAAQGGFGTDWSVVLRVVIPYVLGDNIGTTITAQLAALRTSRNAKRTAMGHTLFNVIGVIYMLPLVWTPLFSNVVQWITPLELSQKTIMLHIFIAHCTFNTVNAIIFLPIIGLLESAVKKIIPITREEMAWRPVVLEQHLLDTPVIALDQAKREIVRMAQTAKRAVVRAVESIITDDRRKFATVREIEDFVDSLQLDITSYLTALSRRQLSDQVSTELPVLLHTVNDLERIADHAINIVEIAQRKLDQKLSFSEPAMAEARRLESEVTRMFDAVIEALQKKDRRAAAAALQNEQNLNAMQIDFRRSHVQRMTDGVCAAEMGVIFIDLVDNVEKVGDHLTNIAQAILGGLQWTGAEY